MTAITIIELQKRYGNVRALAGISLEIPERSLFCLLGPSGCGKTTLLRCLAGLEAPDGGDVLFGERSVARVPAEQRGVGMVFQHYALWPHLSVLNNLLFVLACNGMHGGEAEARARATLALARCAELAERLPGQLSGGQQQRVALARALVHRPRVLLLDEPLSNLDPRLRAELRREIVRVHGELEVTMVYVTHDRAEALEMASEVALLDAGRVVQTAPARDIYFKPQSSFTAAFVSDANILALTPDMRSTLQLFNACPLPREAADPAYRFVCVRPESVRVTAAAAGAPALGTIRTVAFHGGFDLITVDAGGQLVRVQQPSSSSAATWQAGQGVMLEITSADIAVVQT